MTGKRLSRLLAAVALAAGVLMSGAGAAQEKDKKEKTTRKGTVIGELTAKTKNSIDVKADGEAKARRYVPHWRGGAPSAGGGPDKKILEVIAKLKVGSRVRLEWSFEERPRIEKIEVIKAPDDKKAEKKDKTDK